MKPTYFPQATPESQGIPSGEIAKLLDAMERENVQLNSIMILRRGKCLAAGWYKPYGPDTLHAMHSFTKTVCSTAIGFLVQEGKLHLDDKVISFFPEETPESPSENLKKMELRHLLSMTCGHESECSRAGEDWVRDFLHHPVKREPGTYFVYNSMGSYMLTAIIRRVTGQNMTEYLKPRLFEPLGITDYYCATCPRGTENGGGGMCLRTEDMAKIAQFYLQKGRWEGRQLLNAAWIEDATTPHIVQAEGWYPTIEAGMEDYFSGYGYQIWMNSVPTGYRFDGMYAQLGVVLPKYDMVVITTAATCRIYKVLTTLWRVLLPAVYEQPLPEDGAAHRALEEKLGDLSIPWPAGADRSPLEAELDRRPVVLPRNEYSLLPERVRLFGGRVVNDPNDKGLKQLSFEFREDRCLMTYEEWGTSVTLPLGLGENRLPGEVPLKNMERNVLGSFTWEDGHTLRVDLLHVNSVYHRTIRLTFGAGKAVNVEFSELPNDIDPAVNMTFVPKKTFAATLY